MARNRIAKFNIMITASSEQISNVFKRLDKQTRDFGGKITKNLTTASFAFNQIADAVGRFARPLGEAVSRISDLGNVSDRLQIAPGVLQSWQLAARMIGESGDRANDMLTELQNRLGEVRAGIASNDVLEGLQLIGLGVEDLTGTFGEMANKVGNALSQVEDQTVRNAAASKLMGDSAAEMLGVFQDGTLAEATNHLAQMGAVLSEDHVKAVQAMNREWVKLQATTEAYGGVFAAEVGEPIVRALRGMNSELGRMGQLFRSLHQGGTAVLLETLGDIARMFGQGTFANQLKQTMGEAFERPFSINRARVTEQTRAILEGRGTDRLEKIAQQRLRVQQQIRDDLRSGAIRLVESGVN